MLLHPQTVSHRSGEYTSSDDDTPHLQGNKSKWQESSSDEYEDFEVFNPEIEDPITDYKGKFGVISILEDLISEEELD